MCRRFFFRHAHQLAPLGRYGLWRAINPEDACTGTLARIAQAQAEPFLNKTGKADTASCGLSFDLPIQIVVYAERRLHVRKVFDRANPVKSEIVRPL